MPPRPIGSVRYDNQDRVVLVSGGAKGIGRSVCELFAQSGAHVVSMDIDSQAAAQLPQNIEFFRGNSSSEEDCAAAVRRAVQQFGGLDVLVNNAAIQPTDSYVRVDQLQREQWNKMLAVNLTGYTFLAKHALKQMRDQGSGVVVNVASGQAHRTARQVPAYGPIKAANVLQAKQWGVEYARQGIRVVSVSPGAILTPMVQASLAEQGGEAELANRHPIGRLGQAHEVAAAVLWLSSADASFITATDLEVDGGLGAFGAFADPYPEGNQPNGRVTP